MGQYILERGIPSPLGTSAHDGSINFALFSQHATKMILSLFSPGNKTPFLEVSLDPKINRTGYIWHIGIKNLPPIFDYGFRLDKALLLDPYAKRMNTSDEFGDHYYDTHFALGRWKTPRPFDWQNEEPPSIAPKDLIIYEMHVRGFTIDSSSLVTHPGGYLGIIDKIPHLKKLGVNAVELLPIFEFNECENPLKNPQSGKKLYNYWGYSTLNFFCPMQRFAKEDAIDEFKTLVRELHKNGIEVILDVVYNHTAEGNESGKTYSFRGIDNSVYYILSPEGHYMNFSGCGNTFNCNHPITSVLILDSLRYWASEMHVDGFRFDLASILTRDTNGHPMSDPPIARAISKDPVLANCKLIAEAWDAAGLYQVGSFPSYGRWAEWNGKYRDTVRRFIKGTENQTGAFAEALCGSQDLYGSRKPTDSINFITAHDGFSLYDLVSYNQKHNESNGEDNRDGTNDNESWNCGHEGLATDPKTLQLRQRQMRNLHVALMVSIGVPMVLMGDEYAHTRNGNNNTWSHDNELNWFLWDELEKNSDFFRFFSLMIHFRKNEKLLCRSEFLKKEEVDWHGLTSFHPSWHSDSRFVAYKLKDPDGHHPLYIAFNASASRLSVQLPDPPPQRKWLRIVDTALAPPHDFLENPEKFEPIRAPYKMEAYSSLIAKAL